MRESEAIELLRHKVSDEGLLVVGQVGNSTGARQSRTADALMIQTWPSRGLSITGIEYKASRADWRRELRNGQKAEAIAEYCHYWTVLAPKGVVPLEEVPGGWGLWELHKTEKQVRLLRTKNPPPKLDQPTAIDYGFLAAILRAREKYNPNRAKIDVEVTRRMEVKERDFEQRVQRRSKRYEELKKSVAEFEAASGIEIARGWDLEKLGEGLAKFIKDPDQLTQALTWQRETLQRLLDQINKAIP